MRKIKLVCFDVGGTLVYHTRRYQKDEYKKLFKKYGINKNIDIRKISANHFDVKVWNNLDKAIISYMEKIKVTKNKEEFFNKRKYSLINGHHHIKFFKETIQVLNHLRNSGYKIAFITNWNQHARDTLEFLGLSRYADHLLISAEHGYRKPHPSLYKTVLKIFKVKPSEAVMIGDDYEKDYLKPKKLGMHALWLDRRGKSKEGVRNLKQLIYYINKVNKI
ncbi:HAD family hydrolase [Candidatus Woesearchaeota archaeon]|nr:HAD family hydrolase [Candidatus Woesearchaeota archaeon]